MANSICIFVPFAQESATVAHFREMFGLEKDCLGWAPGLPFPENFTIVTTDFIVALDQLPKGVLYFEVSKDAGVQYVGAGTGADYSVHEVGHVIKSDFCIRGNTLGSDQELQVGASST